MTLIEEVLMTSQVTSLHQHDSEKVSTTLFKMKVI